MSLINYLAICIYDIYIRFSYYYRHRGGKRVGRIGWPCKVDVYSLVAHIYVSEKVGDCLPCRAWLESIEPLLGRLFWPKHPCGFPRSWVLCTDTAVIEGLCLRKWVDIWQI